MGRFIMHLLFLGAVSGCTGTSGNLLELPDVAQGGAGAGSVPKPSAEDTEPSPNWSVPDARASFQVQLLGTLDLAIEADTFIVDLDEPSDDELTTLRERGVYLACYFSSGSFEGWRSDATEFPEEVKGQPLPDYPDEQWLDIGNAAVLALMEARMDRAKERGCSGVYPGLVRPGSGQEDFGLQEADFTDYAQELADSAHDRQLGIIYAGDAIYDPGAADYDVAVVYGCAAAQTCESWNDFASAGHHVLLVEFGTADTAEATCDAAPFGEWPTIVKTQELNAFRHECR